LEELANSKARFSRNITPRDCHAARAFVLLQCPFITTSGFLRPPGCSSTMANMNSEPISKEDLLYVLNHVFLPPKLPQEDDYDPGHDFALCQLAYHASNDFARFKFLSDFQKRKWKSVSRMVEGLLKATSVLDKDVLVRAILCLERGGQHC
jgi:hypothetical protein